MAEWIEEWCYWRAIGSSLLNSLAGFVGAGLEDGRYGVCIADWAKIVLAGRLWKRKIEIKLVKSSKKVSLYCTVYITLQNETEILPGIVDE